MKTCVHGIRPKFKCVACRREKDRRLRADNLAEYRERDRLRTPARRVPGRLYRNVWKYGLAPDRFFAMLLDQGSACAVCRVEFETLAAIKIDHVHATGAVRGLLCGTCNVGIGQFHDRPEKLRQAADYLERFK